MRIALLLLCTFLVATSFGQTSANLFTSTKPDVSIVVRTLKSGGQSVEVSMMEADYPPDLLQRQVYAVGKEVGEEPRAFQIERNQIDGRKDLIFLQGLFAIHGLIDRSTGVLRVEPFAKAFAGAPEEHKIDVLMVRFEGERPSENTLRLYNPKDGLVKLQAVPLSKPDGVEYRVQLLTQDPEKIHIPDDKKVAPKAADNGAKKGPNVDWVLIGAFVAAAFAVGALVYSLLLRAGSGNGRSRRA